MFLERFNNYLKFEKRFSVHTITAYKKDLQQFQDFLSELDVDFSNAEHYHVRSWVVEQMEAGCVAKTVNRKLSSVRTFYRFLQREKLVEINPVLQVKAPKLPKRLPVVVPDEQLDALLDNQLVFPDNFEGIRDRLTIEILFGTGIRLAELLSIKVSDVDFYEQTVAVLGKRSKQRIIPLNSTLIKLIREYLDQKDVQHFANLSDCLIVTREGKRVYPKLIYRIVKKYLAYITTNSKQSPHVLRHSFATSLLNNGADLNAIKELLGHASLAATQVYTHNSVEKLKLIYKQAHPRA